ncbi:unnamed protein product, partial [Strongylus vulgaris]
MDLIDLYHAYDHHAAFNDDNVFDDKLMENGVTTAPKDSLKMKKPRFVPWEPYKAAPSPDRKGEAPQKLPTLIPYGGVMLDENSNKKTFEDNILVDARRYRAKLESDVESEEVTALKKELEEVKSQLELERKLNAELKRLMVATISDE